MATDSSGRGTRSDTGTTSDSDVDWQPDTENASSSKAVDDLKFISLPIVKLTTISRWRDGSKRGGDQPERWPSCRRDSDGPPQAAICGPATCWTPPLGGLESIPHELDRALPLRWLSYSVFFFSLPPRWAPTGRGVEPPPADRAAAGAVRISRTALKSAGEKSFPPVGRHLVASLCVLRELATSSLRPSRDATSIAVFSPL